LPVINIYVRTPFVSRGASDLGSGILAQLRDGPRWSLSRAIRRTKRCLERGRKA
jgi:hypothetical protein